MTDSTQEQSFDEWGHFNYGGHYKDRGRAAWDHQQAIIDQLRADKEKQSNDYMAEFLQPNIIPVSRDMLRTWAKYINEDKEVTVRECIESLVLVNEEEPSGIKRYQIATDEEFTDIVFDSEQELEEPDTLQVSREDLQYARDYMIPNNDCDEDSWQKTEDVRGRIEELLKGK